MKTLTKENGITTKTFRSGQGVETQRYWKDSAHWFEIINQYDLITVYVGNKSASIDRVCFEGKKSYLVAMLTRSSKHCFSESTKEEFEEAHKKAEKIINQ